MLKTTGVEAMRGKHASQPGSLMRQLGRESNQMDLGDLLEHVD